MYWYILWKMILVEFNTHITYLVVFLKHRLSFGMESHQRLCTSSRRTYIMLLSLWGKSLEIFPAPLWVAQHVYTHPIQILSPNVVQNSSRQKVSFIQVLDKWRNRLLLLYKLFYLSIILGWKSTGLEKPKCNQLPFLFGQRPSKRVSLQESTDL